jgi:hypothetical protein
MGEEDDRATQGHREAVAAFFGPADYPVLDFGCGPAGGPAALLGADAVPYDPYVRAYAADPWAKRPRGVFSCDVLEHLPLHALRALTGRIAAARHVRAVMFVVSCRAANKVMPNGMNAHLTVRPPAWWDGFFEATLGRTLVQAGATADLRRAESVFTYRREES